MSATFSGRRVYLGNLPYVAKPYDIEDILVTNGFGNIEHIHISIDPVSAKNPGYCFVDFSDNETAQRVIHTLRAEFSGRPIKVGPCSPKKQHDNSSNQEGPFPFKRWGDWKPLSGDNHRLDPPSGEGPHAALDHFNEMIDSHGRRIYVGGLGKMSNQTQHTREIVAILGDFKPLAIGKRITPYRREGTGNHHYCFVDFETKEEAEAATGLNGKSYLGGRLKVAVAKDTPAKLLERRTHGRVDIPKENSFHGGKCGSSNAPDPNRAANSSNWRR